MKIRTELKVVKGNPFAGEDCFIGARIPNFNIINRVHEVVYERLISYVAGYTESGDEILGTKYIVAEEFKNQTISADQINQVLSSFNADLNKNGKYWENIYSAFQEAFRIKVEMDGRYGGVSWIKADQNYDPIPAP